jgi:hypothetical protein
VTGDGNHPRKGDDIPEPLEQDLAQAARRSRGLGEPDSALGRGGDLERSGGRASGFPRGGRGRQGWRHGSRRGASGGQDGAVSASARADVTAPIGGSRHGQEEGQEEGQAGAA